MPLENSIGGTIHRNYDLLLEHDLPITGEVELDVVHCLQALPGTTLEDVKVVYSHPQALAQCENYLKGLGVTVEAVYDTAGGAKLVAEQKLAGAAALASRRAAEVFGLEVLQEAVQDFEFNITRFAIIGGTPAAGANKTTMVFALPSTPGALFKALSVFALRDINLIEARKPADARPPWEYLFYVEVDARRDEPACAEALTHLGDFAQMDARARHLQRRRAPLGEVNPIHYQRLSGANLSAGAVVTTHVRFRHSLLALAVLLTVAAASLSPRIAHPPEYHLFADQRAVVAVPNGLDVLSNLSFAVVGFLGLGVVFARRPRGTTAFADRWTAGLTPCSFSGSLCRAWARRTTTCPRQRAAGVGPAADDGGFHGARHRPPRRAREPASGARGIRAAARGGRAQRRLTGTGASCSMLATCGHISSCSSARCSSSR